MDLLAAHGSGISPLNAYGSLNDTRHIESNGKLFYIQ